jgi:cephalosporin-C deacetylase
VVQYVGYGGGRGLVHEKTFWASAGYAHFVMDTRGQGSAGSVGETADPHDGAPEYPGVLTRGILDPETYYYRRVYTDAVRAVDAVRQHPRVDPSRVAVAGASQGGAITLAVAALADGLVAAMPDVPFLCDIRRACALSDELPYLELVRYLRIHRDQVERVFATLGYIDAAVLAPLADAPALFSVAMLDTVCPPSTVYSAYNAYGGSKQIREYAYNDHEGGGPFHEIVQAEWLAGILAG